MIVSKIALVSDTSSDLPEDLIEELDVHLANAFVHFGPESYVTGDLKMEEFYKKMESVTDDNFPKTSQPRASDLLEIYEYLKSEGYKKIVSIHVSSSLSGTINSANVARGMVDEVDIRIIDSLGVSANLTAAIIKTRELIDRGMVLDDIEEELHIFCSNLISYLTLRTLDNLFKGGRISRFKYWFGSLFNLKPILKFEQGKLEPHARARGIHNARNKMYNIAVENYDKSDNIRYIIAHTRLQKKAEEIESKLLKEFPKAEGILMEIGIVVAVHGGSGAILFLVY